ncbi:MAG TPA: Maf family protein [Armatimonadota bacterium]|nr:Maf family protein [Armatimonadota bacterium]
MTRAEPAGTGDDGGWGEPFEQALRRPLVLASASPRRAELLRQVGLQFEVMVSEAEEAAEAQDAAPAAVAMAHARAKALTIARRAPGRIVLGADTIVVVGERVLGKPGDAGEARAMLHMLSGASHQVITGLALALGDGRSARVLDEDAVVTDVTFRELTDAEIDDYVASGEPLDKAGGYGIQERGALIVRSIRGCYFNVVGLPLARLGEMLARLGCAAGQAPAVCDEVRAADRLPGSDTDR